MYKTLFKIFGVLLLAVLQASLLTKFSFWGALPNVIFSFAIFLLIKNRFEDSLLVALIGGAAMDLTSPLRFGMYIFLFTGILVFLNFIILKAVPSPTLFLSFFIFLGSFLILNLGISLFSFTWLGWSLLLDSIVNAFWGVIIYYFGARMILAEKEIKLS